MDFKTYKIPDGMGMMKINESLEINLGNYNRIFVQDYRDMGHNKIRIFPKNYDEFSRGYSHSGKFTDIPEDKKEVLDKYLKEKGFEKIDNPNL